MHWCNVGTWSPVYICNGLFRLYSLPHFFATSTLVKILFEQAYFFSVASLSGRYYQPASEIILQMLFEFRQFSVQLRLLWDYFHYLISAFQAVSRAPWWPEILLAEHALWCDCKGGILSRLWGFLGKIFLQAQHTNTGPSISLFVISNISSSILLEISFIPKQLFTDFVQIEKLKILVSTYVF